MQEKKTIKHFFFGSASYYVSDGNGDEVVLHVNYKGNSFLINSRGVRTNKKFRSELKCFAQELLQRKHNTDFAKR